ncbi:hypothetical protein [Bacillus salipaludis]|uniref:Uncharacterized protein n=1 Tax=Bacillus salipaludis TaxID=2547811 RepID=A0ABW8RG02_9BACI
MTIAIISLVTWIVIIVFAIVPKRFTLVEMVFLYLASSILTVTIFSILVSNLHWIPASKDVEKALALHICRFVEIPLLLIMSSDILNSPLRIRTRWLIAITIIIFLVVNDWILVSLGILVFKKWNYMYAFIDHSFFVASLSLIARWFIHLKQEGVKRIE